jgi:hypothetical protein
MLLSILIAKLYTKREYSKLEYSRRCQVPDPDTFKGMEEMLCDDATMRPSISIEILKKYMY